MLWMTKTAMSGAKVERCKHGVVSNNVGKNVTGGGIIRSLSAFKEW